MTNIPDQPEDIRFKRSPMMQEIVSSKPGFLIRWGNLIFLLILILIGLACWVIKYPDTIPASGKLTSLNLPQGDQYAAELIIPPSGFDKVAVGQQVLLRFQSYPYQEYGSVMGRIESVRSDPNGTGRATVTFTNGLNTTYNKKIQYSDGLLANAEIVTSEVHLMERFYDRIVQKSGK